MSVEAREYKKEGTRRPGQDSQEGQAQEVREDRSGEVIEGNGRPGKVRRGQEWLAEVRESQESKC